MATITCYGGVREIGGNKFLVEDGGTRVFLDFGMSFGAQGAYFDEFLQPRTNAALRDLLALGILPAIDGIYRHDACVHPGADDHAPGDGGPDDLWRAPVRSYEEVVETDGEPFLDAVVLTHAHADHYGHLGYLDPRIPVHATPVTATLMEAIQEVTSASGFGAEIVHGKTKGVETRTEQARYPGAPYLKGREEWTRPIETHDGYEPFPMGDLMVTLVPVDHSVPGAASVLVETSDGKTIYCTGDVRFHGIFDEVTEELEAWAAEADVDVMLCEGTRIDQDEPDSEDRVREDLTKTFSSTEGLALVDFGWKDTTRFETAQQAAKAAGRELVVSYKLAYLLDALKRRDPSQRSVEDLDHVSVYVRRGSSMLYSPDDYNRDKPKMGYPGDGEERATVHLREGRRAADLRADPSRYVLMLSQWEMTEMLDVRPPKGSTFVRAACEPFSDEMVLDLSRQANWLKRFDIPVRERVVETPDGQTKRVELPEASHASGHAAGPHLKEFIRRVDPDRVVPVHTENEDAFEGVGPTVVRPVVGEPITV